MVSTRRGAIPSELGWLIDELDSISDRLRTLEAPSGEALFDTVTKLQALVNDIQQQLNDYIANGTYNKAQLDSMFASRDSAIASHTHSGGDINSGTIGIGISTGQPVFFTNAYNTNLTGTRRTAWLQSDGRLGYASSTRDKKASIDPANIDPASVLKLEPKSFIYKAEVARRTSLRINEGIDYVPKREYGLIAEDVAEAGLSQFVIYDGNGKIEGVEYSMLVVALIALAKAQDKRIVDLDTRLKKIERSALFLNLGL